MILYLIGYRATGKTTVGRLLADNLCWSFVDTDAMIEKSVGIPISQLFDEKGESHFRELEQKAIEETTSFENTIVSLGGGACERAENRRLIKNAGKAIWLTGQPEILWQRLTGDSATDSQRPNLTSMGGLDEIKHLLSVRNENYAACASYTVDTSELIPEAVASQIANWWESVDKT